jgi:predicted RNase H-like HicB family nuclease
MKFIIAIERGNQHQSFGVAIPDLPGCFSAGDTEEEAIQNAHEAIELWCSTTLEDQGDIPSQRCLAEHQMNPEFTGWTWDVIEVPIERYLNTTAKVDTFALFENQQKVPKMNDFISTNEHNQVMHNTA